MFDVVSVKRMYNIKVSTGKNTWFFVKIDDDDDDDDDGGGGGDELGYSFLNIMCLVQHYPQPVQWFYWNCQLS